MSFPRKEQRQKCYDSRDQYWNCLDRYNSNSNTKTDNNTDDIIPDECKQFQQLFETNCPQQWQQHFNRKYKYLKFKEKIESTGYDPINDHGDKQSS